MKAALAPSAFYRCKSCRPALHLSPCQAGQPVAAARGLTPTHAYVTPLPGSAVAHAPGGSARAAAADAGARGRGAQTFIKVVNYQHMMPTRYTLDVDLKSVVTQDVLDNASKKQEARKARARAPARPRHARRQGRCPRAGAPESVRCAASKRASTAARWACVPGFSASGLAQCAQALLQSRSVARRPPPARTFQGHRLVYAENRHIRTDTSESGSVCGLDGHVGDTALCARRRRRRSSWRRSSRAARTGDLAALPALHISRPAHPAPLSHAQYALQPAYQ